MAEVKLNEAEYQLLQAKSSLETGRMALNSLIGTALHEITEVEDMCDGRWLQLSFSRYIQLLPELHLRTE